MKKAPRFTDEQIIGILREHEILSLSFQVVRAGVSRRKTNAGDFTQTEQLQTDSDPCRPRRGCLLVVCRSVSLWCEVK